MRESRSIVFWLAAAALALGGAFLLVWFFGGAWGAEFAGWRMKTNSAVAITGASIATLAAARKGKWSPAVHLAGGVCCTAIGALTLLEYGSSIDLGIDQLLATDFPFVESLAFPNRMSPNAALCTALIGLAVLLAHSPRRPLAIGAHAMAVVVFVVSALALIGYLYEVSVLYRPTTFIRMSPYTAAAFGLLAAATMARRPDIGLALRFGGPGLGATSARALLPVVVLLPVLGGWLAVSLERHGVLSAATGTALLILTTTSVLVGVVTVLGRSLDRVDMARTSVEEDLRLAAGLTAALAQATTVDEVAEAIVEVGLPAFGAAAGAFLIVSDDGRELVMRASRGYGQRVVSAYATIPLDAPLPAADAARLDEPVFLSSPEEYASRYPSVALAQIVGNNAWAALPLRGRARTVGAIGLSFKDAPALSEPVRTKLVRLASQCALAVERALLFDSERLARERARAAGAAGFVGTWVRNLRTDLVHVDENLSDLFGVALTSGTGAVPFARFLGAIADEDRQRVEAAMRQAVEDKGAFDVEHRLRDAAGRTRWVVSRGRVEVDAAGEPERMAGTLIDVSERRTLLQDLESAVSAEQKARREAEEANRTKDEFLAVLGHELRNPLSPILTSLELMKLRGGDSMLREREVIERQARHMARLVDDLLDVSRAMRGKVDLRKRRVEISTVVAAALETVSDLVEKRNQRVTMDVPERGLSVSGDPARLEQVFSNLLVNACKYTPPGGKITVSAARSGDDVLVRVEDTGEGLAPELLPRVFEMFVQGGRTIDRAQGGLGIGLSIVKSLVSAHGGSIHAASEGPGKGSAFTIRLPFDGSMAPREAAGPRESQERRALVGRRVLVVDDNRDAADLLADALRAVGHEVRTAFDGPSALAEAVEFRPSLVFLDIGLPVIDGYEVARRLRAEPWGPTITIVAMTGYGQNSDRERAVSSGCDMHLVKPIELDVTLAVAARAPAAGDRTGPN